MNIYICIYIYIYILAWSRELASQAFPPISIKNTHTHTQTHTHTHTHTYTHTHTHTQTHTQKTSSHINNKGKKTRRNVHNGTTINAVKSKTNFLRIVNQIFTAAQQRLV